MIQKTLVVVKPDGVRRNLIGEIISRYEKRGLRVVVLKFLEVSSTLIAKHYPEDDEYMISLGKKSEKAGDKIHDYKEHGRMIVKGLREYLRRGSVVAMVLEGEDAIAAVRKITGYTDPATADKGTIRGDLGQDTILEANRQNRPVQNLIHASGNEDEASFEIGLWFPELAA